MLGLAGVTLVVPIVGLVIAVKAHRLARSLKQDLFEVQHRCSLAEERLAKQSQRLKELRHSTAPSPSVQPPAPTPPVQEAAQDAPASVAAGAPSEAPAPVAPPEPPVIEAPPVTPPPETPPPETSPPAYTEPLGPAVNAPPSGFDWEGLIGVRLFAWLGGGALFLGAALFLHYSIQQNLISPPVRVALGLIAGASLLLAGDRLRIKTNLAGQAMAGAGIGTLYAALYAARTLYHLVPVFVAFAGMILVTLTAGVLAAKRAAFVIAVLGLIGGMATPFMLSTGEDHPWSLFAYVALLDVGVVLVVKHRNWPVLALLGLVSSMLVFVGWATHYLYPGRAPFALGAIALVSGVFASVLWTRRDAPRTSGVTSALGQLAIASPLLVSLAFTRMPVLHVTPWFLVSYLIVVSIGAWITARRVAALHLAPAVAALSVLILLSRVGGDLFPARSLSTLASFTCLPAAHFIMWWLRRRELDGPSLRWSLLIALAGPLLLGPAVLGVQAPLPPLWPLAVYTAVHVAGLLWVSTVERESKLLPLAMSLSLVVLISASIEYDTRWFGRIAPYIGASALLFWALPVAAARYRVGRVGWVTAGLSLPLHFVLLYVNARNHWDAGPLGFLAVFGGILTLLLLILARKSEVQERANVIVLSALLGAICLAFLTAALPILLDKQWLTVALGLEVAALGWLRQKIEHSGLAQAAAIIACAVLVRLLLNPALWEYQARTSIPILNFYLYTFGSVASSLLLASRWLRDDEWAQRHFLSPLLSWSSIVLLFVLLNVEVADAYSKGSTVVFRMSGGGLAEDMTYSLVWGLFALVLLGLGILRRLRPLRIGALLVLVGTIAKVFLHDLWQLGALYRVGSIVGLAVALLAVSFLIQRYILREES